MATTTNFGWETPDDTDLVKDGAAAIRTALGGVDTSFVDLKGGTTGQYLTKATNTDLDFTWVTTTADIEGVTATSPLTGGGTSGTVTIGIQSASTAQLGAVQLTDSTASTSITTAATPNSVKTSYDLAAAAIPKSTVTTSGDIIYATGSSTVTRRGIGSTGDVLTVSGGVPVWSAPASGAYTSLASGSISGTLTLSSINQTYRNLVLVLNNWTVSTASKPTLYPNDTSNLMSTWYQWSNGSSYGANFGSATAINLINLNNAGTGTNNNHTVLTFPEYAVAQNKTVQWTTSALVSGTRQGEFSAGAINTTSALTSLVVYGLNGGSYVLYGVK